MRLLSWPARLHQQTDKHKVTHFLELPVKVQVGVMTVKLSSYISVCHKDLLRPSVWEFGGCKSEK